MENGHHNNVMKFREWLHHPSRTFADIWDVYGNRVIGLSESLIELFNGVIEMLNDIHQRNVFNGNLLENLRISSVTVGLRLPWKVEFVNNPPPNLIDPIKGIIADVQHLRYMVYSVKFRFPLNVPYLYPDAWLLYLKPLYGFDQPYAVNGFDQPHEYDSCLRYVKKVAFYNYSHPLFFDKVKMAHFIYKVYEIRKRNPQMFNRLVRLDQTTPLTNMTDWLAAIPINLFLPNGDINQPPLRQVLYDRARYDSQGQPLFRDNYQFPNDVVTYLRTVCEHARDINRDVWSGKILKELHQVLPDALPKIHFLLCSKFDDQICLTHFSANHMVKLMRHGPFGYKGLKL
ncbi:hypothetical protein ACSBR2_025892 [Camellia fascicularis]